MDPPDLSTMIFFFHVVCDIFQFCYMVCPTFPRNHSFLHCYLNTRHYIQQSNAKTPDVSCKILKRFRKSSFTTSILSWMGGRGFSPLFLLYCLCESPSFPYFTIGSFNFQLPMAQISRPLEAWVNMGKYMILAGMIGIRDTNKTSSNFFVYLSSTIPESIIKSSSFDEELLQTEGNRFEHLAIF